MEKTETLEECEERVLNSWGYIPDGCNISEYLNKDVPINPPVITVRMPEIEIRPKKAFNAVIGKDTDLEQTIITTVPQALSNDELRNLYKGTVFGVFLDEVYKSEPRIKTELALMGALTLQSALMAPCVTIDFKRPCFWGISVANAERGKGTISNCVDTCLDYFGLDTIDSSSQKTLLKKGLGPNPWSVCFLNEFSMYLKPRSWQSDAIPIMLQSFDDNKVTSSSEKTGNCRIHNSAMTVLASVQLEAFFAGAKGLKEVGYLSRSLLAIDNTITPKYRLLEYIKSNPIDTHLIFESFQSYYSWLPARMKPDKGNEGVWRHPTASFNINTEEYKSLLYTYKTENVDLNRYLKRYLPLLSIPFESPENLSKGILTAKALERGDRALLTFYWNLVTVYDQMTVSELDKHIKKIVNYVNNHPLGSVRAKIQKGVDYSDAKMFASALDTVSQRGLVRFLGDKYFPLTSNLEMPKLAPLPAIEIKPLERIPDAPIELKPEKAIIPAPTVSRAMEATEADPFADMVPSNSKPKAEEFF